MDAKKLYARLEKDFIKPGMSDDWVRHMPEIRDFLSENFIKRSMGLVCDNSERIYEVYTAVFPTNEVMETVLKQGGENTMLFVHHPSIWEITEKGVWEPEMNRKLLEQFREKGISIYNLHVPLDSFGKYSTSTCLARELGLKFTPRDAFFDYNGGLAGIFGKGVGTIDELRKRFEKAVGHRITSYEYGENEIKDGIVAVIAGGGNEVEALKELVKKKVNTFVTGVTRIGDYAPALEAHNYAKAHGINILGGTHYSTEKFACMAMCDYFEKLGLRSEFIAGKPCMKDL